MARCFDIRYDKTFQKWAKLFIAKLANLTPEVVSDCWLRFDGKWENRYTNNQGKDSLISVDCIDWNFQQVKIPNSLNAQVRKKPSMGLHFTTKSEYLYCAVTLSISMGKGKLLSFICLSSSCFSSPNFPRDPLLEAITMT
jgi:hypothetical protein